MAETHGKHSEKRTKPTHHCMLRISKKVSKRLMHPGMSSDVEYMRQRCVASCFTVVSKSSFEVKKLNKFVTAVA